MVGLCGYTQHISGTTLPNFTKCFIYVANDRRWAYFWRRCDTMYTSCFVDDVFFLSWTRWRCDPSAALQQPRCSVAYVLTPLLSGPLRFGSCDYNTAY